MRKNISRLALFMVLFAWLSPDVHAFTNFAVSEAGNPQEKEQTVKVVIKKEGKLIEKDTTFSDKGKGSKSYTYTYTIGDTLQNDIPAKVARLGDQKRLIIMQESEGDTFDIRVPPPVNAAVWVEGHQTRDPYAFDSSDPNIVSYKKKDIGKGQEKITIVRKKVVVPEGKK
jgi:hypothetical protein